MELQSSWVSSAEKDLLLIPGHYYICTGKFCVYFCAMVFYTIVWKMY